MQRPTTPPQARPQVSQGLNLALRLKSPALMRELLRAIDGMLPAVRAALEGLHYVHFARFLPTSDGSTLLVITEFDGALDRYVLDFASVLSDEFSTILGYVEGAPPLPVREHREAFWAFVKRHNEERIQPWSAYPDMTVIDILGPRRLRAAAFAEAPPADIEFADVQGNVLNGYNARHARHFALAVDDADRARQFIEGLVGGDEAASPQVTTGLRGSTKPSYFLNVGFTARGLEALGVESVGTRFPPAFVEGPAHPARARRLRDEGPSAPEHWRLGAPDQPVDLLVSLYAKTSASVLEEQSKRLRALFGRSGLRELAAHEAAALDGQRAHFGFRDGVGQPRIAGVPKLNRKREMPDRQPQAGAGEFLLGGSYANQHGANFIGALPPELATNGTYAVVRVLQQDTAAFDRLLAETSERYRIDPELVAAKLMGRWRSGTPLSLSPERDTPLPDRRLNDFDFAPSAGHPDAYDDAEGLRCPVGSHMRRMNPRGGLVAGKPYSRRLIRRGMPYGPPWDPDRPDDAERGLFGLFFCADIESQYEFLLEVWAYDGLQASGIRHTQDPILGTAPGAFSFGVPGLAAPVTMSVPRLVTTRGSLYLFVPGLRGLRHLAQPRKRRPVTRASRGIEFDPHDPAYVADPYAAYRSLRDAGGGVHPAPKPYPGYWVFRYDDVRRVCEERDVFLKPRSANRDQGPLEVLLGLPEGVFNLNPPRHGEVRRMLDPLFQQVLAPAAEAAERMAAGLVEKMRARPVADLLMDFARPLSSQVFMTVMGLPEAHRRAVGEWSVAALDGHDVTEEPWKRSRAGTCTLTLRAYYQGLLAGCPRQAAEGRGLVDGMAALRGAAQGPASMTPDELQQTAHNLTLGGFLSTEFLLLTGTWNLLNHREQLAWLREHPEGLDDAVAEMLRYDAPFQMADREVAKDVTLGGVQLKPGDRVTVVFGSANRDERAFLDPDRFDVRRERDPKKPHFGLGHGIHACIGAPLVATVAPIAFRRLLADMPGLAPGPKAPEWQKNPYFRSFVELVLLTAGALPGPGGDMPLSMSA